MFLGSPGWNRPGPGCLTLWEPILLQLVFCSGCKTTYIDAALKVSSLQNNDSFMYRHQLNSLEKLLSSIDS